MNKGLNNEQLQANIEKYGLNKLTEGKKKNPLKVILSQFADSLTILLLIAALISFIVGEAADAIIILAVLVINATIGAVQELNAEKALEALKQMSSPTAIVIRDGVQKEIPAEELTVGDYVILEAGRVVPADILLTASASLKINESALTGESVPVEKDYSAKCDENAPLGDRLNNCFSSTLVTYGRGEGEVIAIGENTEIGKIAKMLKEVKEEQTPLQKNLDKLSKILGFAGIALCILMFVFQYFIGKNDLLETLILAISFAVAVIPESLATVVTIVLSLGVKRMANKNAIVKQLQAVETLGAVNVICSDKTGTLTQNKMTVMQYFFNNKIIENSTIEENNTLLNGFILCNDSKVTETESIGDPTEVALIEFGLKNKYDIDGLNSKYPRINELPFDSDRKMMTTLHQLEDKTMSYTKGAIESILPVCTKILIDGKVRDLTENDKKIINDAALEMSSDALRVLVIAQKENNTSLEEKDLTFLGFVGMIDPAKEGVKETIEIAHNAGIDVVMITGDNKITAFAIAKELNICNDINQCMSGQEIDEIDDETFRKNILNYRVFARVSPEHKVKIVQAFKSHNKICSMTGDGVNDSPSLKAADIGVAMGKGGTDVAKGSADMILTDDNFITIVKAVKEGRNIFNNIKKSITYLLRANFSEIVIMCGAIFSGLASPLSTIQILWVNLVTDSVPSLALGMDKGSNEVMDEKPRDVKKGLLNKNDYLSIVIKGTICGLFTLGAFLYPLIALNGFSNWEILLEGDLLERCRTFAFCTLVFTELIMTYSCKNINKSVFSKETFNNKALNLSVIFGMALQILIVNVEPIRNLLNLSYVSLTDWLVIVGFSIIPLLLLEVVNLFKKNK